MECDSETKKKMHQILSNARAMCENDDDDEEEPEELGKYLGI